MEKMVNIDKKVKVSVIMLVHNREEYITESISSILNQNFEDFEFIIVNNGSIDESEKIIKKITEEDSRVKYIKLETSQIGIGRNKGLELANGEYVTFVDDDDIAEQDMISFLYNLIKIYDADISICGSTKLVKGQKISNYIFNEVMIMDAKEAVVEMLKRKKYNVGLPTKLIKKALFDEIRFWENGNYDDIRVGYKYLASARKVIAKGEPKYCVRRHENNNSAFTTNDSLITPNQLDEYIQAFKERTNYLINIYPELENFVRYSEWSFMISMCNKINTNGLVGCEKQLNYFMDELLKNYDAFYYSNYIQDFEKEYMIKYIGSAE